ncbi:YlcI/YnfO family protein [Sodalis endosymbiont of Spalangia cameroni]|uniref:YlcI/YnfO family protein n=1 Tax=Sodalis praecaptivus TaxID=1239307 RepID=UPI0031F7CED4
MQEKTSKHKFDRSNSTMKNIRFEDDLLEKIEKIAGKGQFSAWVKQACLQRVERESKSPKG